MNTVQKSISIAATAAFLAISGMGAAAQAAKPAKADKEVVHCYGVNTCKGTSDCATAKTSCKGQNECKGSGFLAKTASECAKLGGSLTEKTS
jgi:uncharacterized membrane protein